MTTTDITPAVTTTASWSEADGVVTVTMHNPQRRVNTMNGEFRSDLAAVADRLLARRAELRGVIITPATCTSFEGGDWHELVDSGLEQRDEVAELAELADGVKRSLRIIETLGVPVVAAINGSALGGDLEIALACHHRIAVDAPALRVGLSEVTFGLLPGGGGVVRSVRLLGLVTALGSLLLSGAQLAPAAALELGVLDELVGDETDLLPRARDWIAAHPKSMARWDVPGYQIPGGTPNHGAVTDLLPALTAQLRKRRRGAPMPADRAILSAAVEGAQVDFDSASVIETRYFVQVAAGPVAKNIIQGTFLDLHAVRAGANRPEGFTPRSASTMAVIGAGMMGAGIAFVAAKAGMTVLLKDVDMAAAERGKQYAAVRLANEVKRGQRSETGAAEVLERIVPTARYADLAASDLVVEAVFEDPGLKALIFDEVMKVVAPGCLIASNTSSLPISELAAGVDRAENLVGLHFFSPVERMELVEVIAGKQTSDATLAAAFDIVRTLGKTPIVVNDGRGFFTSRVILSRLVEAAAMLADGVAPASIEQASLQAGYPVGTLALLDELTLSLPLKIRGQFREAAVAAGSVWTEHPGDAVLARVAVEHDRPGRAAGGGFYDYIDGQRAGIWSGLAENYPVATGSPVPLADLVDRLLFAEALDTVRCFEEGVLRSAADANVGSLLGIGYPTWTGGAAQIVNGWVDRTGAASGLAGFVTRADELAGRYGARFTPPQYLTELAADNRMLG